MDNETVFQFIKVRYVVLWVIVGIVLFFIFWGMLGDSLGNPEGAVISAFVFYAIISYWIIRNFKKVKIDYRKFIGNLPVYHNWLYLLGIVIVLLIFSISLNELSNYILSSLDPTILTKIPDTSFFFRLKETSMAPLLNFLNFIIGVVVAPIVEEFLFRGVMVHRFTVKWGISKAVLASSLIFGILHSDFIGAFLFGVLMCILYIKTRTLIIPIICHMLNNGIVYGIFMWQGFGHGSTQMGLVTQNPNLGVAVYLLMISAPVMAYFIYKNWPHSYWKPPYFCEDYKTDDFYN